MGDRETHSGHLITPHPWARFSLGLGPQFPTCTALESLRQVQAG
jgi:hypothetical protein